MNLAKNEMSWLEEEILTDMSVKKYQLYDNIPLRFSLSDSSIFLKQVQNLIKTNEAINLRVAHKINSLQNDLNIDFWLRFEDESIIKMNVLDIYEIFIKNLKTNEFEDQLYNCQDVSFVGPLGPYKDTSLISCLNQDVIDFYLFQNLVKNKLPHRGIRLHTSGVVLTRYGRDFEHKANLEVRQITDNGILFSADDDLLLQEYSQCDYIKFHMNTEAIANITEGRTGSLDSQLFYTEDELRYFYVEESKMVKSLSYKSGESGEFYFFVRYRNMLESDVPTIFGKFMNKMKDYFKHLSS